MKKIIITLALLISHNALTAEHSLGAHEHGSVKLGIAVEKNQADFDLDGPAESFLGFEHLPKTAKEKKLLDDLKMLWEKNIFTVLNFDKNLNCKVAQSSLNQVVDEMESKGKKEAGVHSDIEAKAHIVCAHDVAGSTLLVSLKKQFKSIKKLTADIISSETKSVEITGPTQSIKL